MRQLRDAHIPNHLNHMEIDRLITAHNSYSDIVEQYWLPRQHFESLSISLFFGHHDLILHILIEVSFLFSRHISYTYTHSNSGSALWTDT
jgi:hypothetical protein